MGLLECPNSLAAGFPEGMIQRESEALRLLWRSPKCHDWHCCHTLVIGSESVSPAHSCGRGNVPSQGVMAASKPQPF